MKRANSTTLLLGFLGLCTVLSIGGAVSSSLAWYAYASRAALMYSGTSVFDNGQLEIGVKSDIQIPDLETAGMVEEVHGGSYYYFAPVGEGLSSAYLNTYLEARGYASNELLPVTSGQFDPADANHNTHALLMPPSAEVPHPTAASNRASISNYSKITFAFKAFYTDADGVQHYAANQELWLTYVQTRASQGSAGKVVNSMRMYIERDVTTYGANNGFIFNPSSKDSGATKVGGLLNLGYDEFYDFNEQGEIVYGDYEVIDDSIGSGISTGPYVGDDNIWDVNDKWDWDYKPNTEANQQYADTFTATHSVNAPYYFENLDNLDIKTAKYQGTDDTVQKKDANGVLANPQGKKTSVCITGDQTVGYIGEFDATIYLEGWDFSVIDEEQSHKFDFQLRFETNPVTNPQQP